MPQIFPFIGTEDDDSTIRQLSLYQRNFDDREKLWSQQLSVGLEAEDTMYYFEVEMTGAGLNIEEGEGLKDATFMVCNAKGYGYGYFRMGPLTKKRWLEKMQNFEDPVLRGVFHATSFPS